MTTAVTGIPVTLVARFEAAGVVMDPELPLRLTVAPLAGGPTVVDTTDVEHPSTGIFTYTWTPVTAGDFLAVWDPSGDDITAVEVVSVLPASTGTWATVAQALGFTGKTVEETDLTVASTLIGLYAGVQSDQPQDSISSRDRHWLAMATSFQAIWMATKPDLMEYRESHRTTSADGVHVARSSDSDLMLAPLAARALRNLSWIGPRTILALPEGYRVKGMVDPHREDQDHLNAWMSRPIA